MATITVPKETFSRILTELESVIGDLEELYDQDIVAKKRLEEIKQGKVKLKSEKDYYAYLKRRGVKVE